MTPDPAKQETGRLGGLTTARRRLDHLSDVEVEVLRELERQAHAYRDGTAREPHGVAAWLRALADRLEAQAVSELNHELERLIDEAEFCELARLLQELIAAEPHLANIVIGALGGKP